MGVPRYGISLRVFNSIRVIPYLQATTYYFVYHINAIALYWEEKPTSLMHENKWPDNPRITIIECVGAHPEDGKVRWIVITKTTMIVIFNLQSSHLLTLSIPTKEVFQLNGQNRPMANLAIVDFHSQPREMPTPTSSYNQEYNGTRFRWSILTYPHNSQGAAFSIQPEFKILFLQ